MGDVGEQATFPSDDVPASPRRGRRWLQPWSSTATLALLVMLALGVSGCTGIGHGAGRTQGAPVAAGGATPHQVPQAEVAMHGQCGGELTVSRVTNRTITVTRADGSTATVYVNSHIQFTRSGNVVALGVVAVRSRIYVVGSCMGGGSRIKAASIQVVG